GSRLIRLSTVKSRSPTSVLVLMSVSAVAPISELLLAPESPLLLTMATAAESVAVGFAICSEYVLFATELAVLDGLALSTDTAVVLSGNKSLSLKLLPLSEASAACSDSYSACKRCCSPFACARYKGWNCSIRAAAESLLRIG